MQVTCEVEVEVEDILDQLDNKQLAKYGLIRTRAAGPAWQEVQSALRTQDQNRLDNLLSSMAWEQGGVILSVGIPLVH